VVNNLDAFTDSQEKGDKRGPNTRQLEFQVNVLVDNSRTEDVPVIIETAPRYSNLFGMIERLVDERGDHRSDLTMIRAGSFLQANGGFLVLNLTDIFEEFGVWPSLKRALKFDVKVVLIGDAESYSILYHYDEDFRKIFKVKADFDTEMPNTAENLNRYGQFVRNLTDSEKLLPFHKTAVAACIEQGAEVAGRQDRLTTRFSDIADIIREANYWAKKDDTKVVHARHVKKAVAERIRRVNLAEEKIGEMLLEGTILLDIDGSKVGQVNGLAVYDLGDYSFGKPVRITVETSMGRAGIINIEREAEMSGKTYNKGSLILEGYLRRRFAQERPLAMSASICFGFLRYL
jgi:ATP-dependent Lon protease